MQMTSLQYDARTKQAIKTLLYDFLYKPVHKKYGQTLKDIVLQNCKLFNNYMPSFIFRGEIYTSDPSVRPLPRMNRLHPTLEPAMLNYLRDVKELNEHEVPYVLGFITQVLNASNDLPDYLRLLPESVHAPIQALIDNCNCRTKALTQEQVDVLKSKNAASIHLMAQRQVMNLLI